MPSISFTNVSAVIAMIVLLSSMSLKRSTNAYFSLRGAASAGPDFDFWSAIWAITPARLRTGPFNTVTRRRIGDCMHEEQLRDQLLARRAAPRSP